MEIQSFLKKFGIGIAIYFGIILAIILVAIVVVDQNPELNTEETSIHQSIFQESGEIGTGSGVLIPDHAPRLGNPDAPVTIIEFADFQCPFCQESFPKIRQLMNEFPDQIQLVYRHFPIRSIHPLADELAHASMCAHEQEKFWPFHDRLFQNQESLTEENLAEQARAAGLDLNQFLSCQSSERWYDEINLDINDAVANGGRGTPTWLVNGKVYQGDIPSTIWSQIITQELQ